MRDRVFYYLDSLIERYPLLSQCKNSILDAFNILEKCFSTGHKLLIAGNGGSCADSEHIVGELMKGFKNRRKCSCEFANRLKSIDFTRGDELANKIQGALPAIALDGHQSLNTAFVNDVEDGGLLLFAQQVYGYGVKGDTFLAISTSGNSKNVINAAIVAKAKGMQVIGLTGCDGGELIKYTDAAIVAPQSETYMIQELHLPIYHCLCLMLEEKFFN